MDRPYISVVMPAYNEQDNIENTIRGCFEALKGMNSEVVVTDDGSKDNTLQILHRLVKEYPKLVIVKHDKNMGYGAGLKDAIEASRGEVVVSIDSDGQFDISELSRFLELLNNSAGLNVICGHRAKKQDTLFKVISDRGLNFIIRLLFGLRLKDVNCAFKLYRAQILRSISIESKGFQAPTEIMIKLKALGYDIKELCISHLPRKKGKSALKPIKTICEVMFFLIYLKLKIALFRRGLVSYL